MTLPSFASLMRTGPNLNQSVNADVICSAHEDWSLYPGEQCRCKKNPLLFPITDEEIFESLRFFLQYFCIMLNLKTYCIAKYNGTGIVF